MIHTKMLQKSPLFSTQTLPRSVLLSATSFPSDTALSRPRTLIVCRKLLSDTLISGDVELLLKRCLILHHPFTSEKLKSALGESILSQCQILSDDGIRGYYKAGYRNLVSEYSRMGILDQNQLERLDEWVTQDQHEDVKTAEYSQLLEALK